MFTFTDSYARDYDDPRIGHIEPGDVRDLTDAPDWRWTPAASPPMTAEAPAEAEGS